MLLGALIFHKHIFFFVIFQHLTTIENKILDSIAWTSVSNIYNQLNMTRKCHNQIT